MVVLAMMVVILFGINHDDHNISWKAPNFLTSAKANSPFPQDIKEDDHHICYIQ